MSRAGVRTELERLDLPRFATAPFSGTAERLMDSNAEAYSIRLLHTPPPQLPI